MKLAVIVGVVFGVLHLLGMLDLGKWRVNGPILGAVMVVWAGVYPLMSFMTANVKMAMERERLVNAFASLDYVLVAEEGERMVFRARSILRRVLWNFDDAVSVTRDGGFIDIEGTKRIVPRVESRLKI